MGILVLVLVAGLGTIGYVVFKPKPAPIVLDPNIPLPKAEGHVMGSDTAKVEITEYGDFECPICGQFATVTEPDVRKRIVETGLARYRYMDFPFDFHPQTLFAHNAAACAGAQGKFWEMHDKLYEGQLEWTGLNVSHVPNATKIMKLYAKGLGLDTKAFDACFDARQFQPQIMANKKLGDDLHVNATPTFFVNNQMLTPGLVPYDVLKHIVDSVNAVTPKTPPAKAGGDTAKKTPVKVKGQ
jgi:protein-disulfide isomerase